MKAVAICFCAPRPFTSASIRPRAHHSTDDQTEGGFPELKVLKQRVRNLVSPDMGLGHSDKPGTPVIAQSTH
jgi:predicted Rdx family selenoprotein